MYVGVKVLIVGLGAVLLLSAMSLGAYFGALHAPQQQHQNSVSSNHRTEGGAHGSAQVKGNAIAASDAPEGQEASSGAKEREEREKRDLDAQESMSRYAFWTLLITSGGLLVTAAGTAMLLWQISLTRDALKTSSDANLAMQDANDIMRKAEDAQLIFHFPSGSQDSEGDFLLDALITNIGRSACKIHTVDICGEIIIMETVILPGSSKALSDFAIVPAGSNGLLLLAVDATHAISGRRVDYTTYRVLPPKGPRTTWWALQMDNIRMSQD